MVERPSEVDEILGLLKEGNNKVSVVGSRSGDVVGIRGMGGLGKTVLAQAVAWAASVSRKVIWLDIGETPDCLALINVLIKDLGGAVSFNDIRGAQDWVKENTVCMHVIFFVFLIKAMLYKTIFNKDL
jgi:MinD superfamily P-loop ATPase